MRGTFVKIMHLCALAAFAQACSPAITTPPEAAASKTTTIVKSGSTDTGVNDDLTLTSISPSSQFVGGAIFIKGTGLNKAVGFFIGDGEASDFFAVDSKNIILVVPTDATSGDVMAYDIDGNFSLLESGFTLLTSSGGSSSSSTSNSSSSDSSSASPSPSPSASNDFGLLNSITGLWFRSVEPGDPGCNIDTPNLGQSRADVKKLNTFGAPLTNGSAIYSNNNCSGTPDTVENIEENTSIFQISKFNGFVPAEHSDWDSLYFNFYFPNTTDYGTIGYAVRATGDTTVFEYAKFNKPDYSWPAGWAFSDWNNYLLNNSNSTLYDFENTPAGMFGYYFKTFSDVTEITTSPSPSPSDSPSASPSAAPTIVFSYNGTPLTSTGGMGASISSYLLISGGTSPYAITDSTCGAVAEISHYMAMVDAVQIYSQYDSANCHFRVRDINGYYSDFFDFNFTYNGGSPSVAPSPGLILSTGSFDGTFGGSDTAYGLKFNSSTSGGVLIDVSGGSGAPYSYSIVSDGSEPDCATAVTYMDMGGGGTPGIWISSQGNGKCRLQVLDSSSTYSADIHITVGSGVSPSASPSPSASASPSESPSASPSPSSSYSWVARSPMNISRADHTATLLHNGKVFVTGGSQGGMSGSTNGTQMYDPVMDTWTAKAPMSAIRYSHLATLLSNGNILIVGGGGSPEVYDTANDTWNATQAMNNSVGDTATLLNNGKVLVAGGTNTNSTEIYDPYDNSWNATSSMVFAVTGSKAAVLKYNKVLLTGGSDVNGPVKSTQIYDVGLDTWTAASDSNVARRGAIAVTLKDNRVLVAGGYGGNAAPSLASAEIYDQNSNTWTNVAPMGTGRWLAFATLLSDGRVLVAGGLTNDSYSDATNTVEIYDPTLDSWTSLPSMTQARSLSNLTVLSNGTVLVTGGHGVSTPTDGVEELTPGPSQHLADLPQDTSRDGATATLLSGGQILIAGGLHNDSNAPRARIYSPGANISILPSGTMNEIRRYHRATLLDDGRVLLSGGTNFVGTTSSNTAEIYDPNTQTFTVATGTMSAGRYMHMAVKLSDGRVLLVGGVDGAIGQGSADIFDPSNNTITPTGTSMNTSRGVAVATTYTSGTEKVLFAGGLGSGGFYDSIEIFDVSDYSFSNVVATLSAKRAAATSARLSNGKIMIAGGSIDSNWYGQTSVDLFDPSDNSVSAAPVNLQVARTKHFMFPIPGYTDTFFIVGTSYEMTSEVYNPFTSTGLSPITMQSHHDHQNAAAQFDSNHVLLIGGTTTYAVSEVLTFTLP